MSRGLFITFEGIDGCGKSTQLKLVSEFLTNMGKDILFVREPGGTTVGEKIREVLLDKKNDSMTPMAELFLYEAARAQIVEERIIPAISAGKCVLCDRFFDSTTAYQGFARGLGDKLVTDLNMIATSEVKPDITFLLDITPEAAQRRRIGRGEEEDRLEALGTSFQEKVREGYLNAAYKDDRIKVIDASGTPDRIFEEIKNYLVDFLDRAGE